MTGAMLVTDAKGAAITNCIKGIATTTADWQDNPVGTRHDVSEIKRTRHNSVSGSCVWQVFLLKALKIVGHVINWLYLCGQK